jgi:hypothetical protein
MIAPLFGDQLGQIGAIVIFGTLDGAGPDIAEQRFHGIGVLAMVSSSL